MKLKRAILMFTSFLIIGHFGEKYILNLENEKNLKNRSKLETEIRDLCGKPKARRKSRVFSGSKIYQYQLYCDPQELDGGDGIQSYKIRYRGPFGYLSGWRLFGESNRDYFNRSGWVLYPEIAEINSEGIIKWYSQ